MKNIKVNLIEKRIIRRKILNFISPVSELPGYDKIKKLLEIIFQNTNKSVNTFKIIKGNRRDLKNYELPAPQKRMRGERINN